MKDHEKRELVDRLTKLAQEFADTQQLRARIAGEVLPALTCVQTGERERCAKLQTVASQVLRDMQAQGVLIEWQTVLAEALGERECEHCGNAFTGEAGRSICGDCLAAYSEAMRQDEQRAEWHAEMRRDAFGA